MPLETIPFDAGEFLDCEGLSELTADAVASGNAAYIDHALGIVARAEAETIRSEAVRLAAEVRPSAPFKAVRKRGRPRSPNKRVRLSLRLDPNVLAAFQSTGPGWQTRINEAIAKAAAEIKR